MRRLLLILLAASIAVASAGCSARLVSVGHIEPIVVRKGRILDTQAIPDKVPVIDSNGKTTLHTVNWDLGTWVSDPLYDDMVVSGTIEGTDLRAQLTIAVSVGDVATLRLSEGESADPNLPDVMQRKAKDNEFVDESVWSPDHSVLALIFGERLCVWKVGEPTPEVVDAVAAGYPYHDVGWSFDGKLLSIYPHPSSESALVAVRYPELDVKCRLDVASVGFWSPDSHELLVGIRNDTGIDLAVLDIDTGSARTLLKADPTTVYRPDGWAGPGVAEYSNLRAQGPATEDKTGLTIPTR